MLVRTGTKATLIHCWWECKNGTATLEDRLFPKKLNIANHMILLLVIYPNEMKIYFHTKICP